MEHLIQVFTTPASWIAVFTLTLLEIVLGIDNLVFIAILTARLEPHRQKMARQLGLAAALITRIALLASISWLANLTTPLFSVPTFAHPGTPLEVSGKTLVLFVGGLFLIYKSVSEIYHKMELKDEGVHPSAARRSLGLVIANIALMDVIFSLDSVITAVGMVNELPIMITAIMIAIIVMIAFANPVSNFINENASLKILALAFLLMIGTLLTAESLDFEVPKGFVYFSMFFALGVQLIMMRYETNLKRREEENGTSII